VMNFVITDYNEADRIGKDECAREWREIELALKALPLYLKASDQAGRQGTAIFDPVATNAFIKGRLEGSGWAVVPIPAEYDSFGTDIDSGKNGVIVEIQFSNYPFLPNNTVRADVFFRERVAIRGRVTTLAVIISKGHMFPASNSTLYYEQAKRQLDALAKYQVFRVPLRLVGLMSPIREGVAAIWTPYGARYSRDMSRQREVKCDIQGSPGERCRISVRR